MPGTQARPEWQCTKWMNAPPPRPRCPGSPRGRQSALGPSGPDVWAARNSPLPFHGMALLPVRVSPHPSPPASWTSWAGGKVRPPIFLPSFPAPTPLSIPPSPGLSLPVAWKLVWRIHPHQDDDVNLSFPRTFAFFNEARLEQLFTQCMPVSWCNSQDRMFQRNTTFPSPRSWETVSGQGAEGDGERVHFQAQPLGQRLGPSKPWPQMLNLHLPFPPPRRPGSVPQSIPKPPAGSAFWNPSRGSPGNPEQKPYPFRSHRSPRLPPPHLLTSQQSDGLFPASGGPGPEGHLPPQPDRRRGTRCPRRRWNEGCPGPP